MINKALTLSILAFLLALIGEIIFSVFFVSVATFLVVIELSKNKKHESN